MAGRRARGIVERSAHVGGLGVQAPEPGPLVIAAKAGCRALREVTVELAVPPPHLGVLPRLPQALHAVRCHALQQPVSRAIRLVRAVSPVRPVCDHDEGAVDQPGQQAEHIQVIFSADCLGSPQVAAVCRHCQPPQHHPFRLGE